MPTRVPSSDRTLMSNIAFVSITWHGLGSQYSTSLGAEYTTAEVLAVEMENRPGALTRVLEELAAEHINVDYAYCSSGGRNGRVVGIFKVSNSEKAMRVLASSANNSNRRPERRQLRDQRAYAVRGAAGRR